MWVLGVHIHQRQIKVVCPCFGHRGTDVAGGVANHPGQPLRCCKFGCDYRVTFVLAVLGVGDQDRLPLPKGLKDLFDGRMFNLHLSELQQSLDVFCHDVYLNVDLVAWNFSAQSGHGQGLRDQ